MTTSWRENVRIAVRLQRDGSLRLAPGARGEDIASLMADIVSRRRAPRPAPHVWVDRDDEDEAPECRWCRIRQDWPGASMDCGNVHARTKAAARKRSRARKAAR